MDIIKKISKSSDEEMKDWPDHHRHRPREPDIKSADWADRQNNSKNTKEMNRTFKIETILYSKPITSKHHLHAIEASNRDGKQYLLLYLTHCKNLVAYIDDLATVPVARVFEKDFFLLVENEDCYAYLAGDGNGEFALSIFTEKKTWSEKIVIPDLSSTLSRGA